MPTGVLSVPTTALGARLRQLRKRSKWTQTQMAVKMGTRANRISDWETGRFEPSLPVLKRYAELFGITVADLLGGVM